MQPEPMHSLTEELDVAAELDLFSDEIEDRFNAGAGSTMSTFSCAGSCVSTASSICFGS